MTNKLKQILPIKSELLNKNSNRPTEKKHCIDSQELRSKLIQVK